jgi:transketolase
VAVELGISLGWERWTGDEGAIMGLDRYGASAPATTILEEFGFTVEHVASVGREVVGEGFRGRAASPPAPEGSSD